MNTPLVNIISLHYNQVQYTLDFIESLMKLEYDNYKIILVDNGSRLESYNELLSKLTKSDKIIIYRIDKNRGYSGGINYGLEKALIFNPDYLMIINNDTIVDANSLTELVASCQRYDNKAIITGKVYYYDEPQKIQHIGYKYTNKNFLLSESIGVNEIDKGQFDIEEERDNIDDVFWVFHSDIIKKIGFYSTFFWFNYEQTEFAIRAKKNGYKLIFNPNAKIWHKGSISIGGRDNNPILAYWSMQGALIYRFLHLKKTNFIIFFLYSLFIILLSYFKIFKKVKVIKKLISVSNAKFRGLLYFLSWLFLRNENKGNNPYLKIKK